MNEPGTVREVLSGWSEHSLLKGSVARDILRSEGDPFLDAIYVTTDGPGLVVSREAVEAAANAVMAMYEPHDIGEEVAKREVLTILSALNVRVEDEPPEAE